MDVPGRGFPYSTQREIDPNIWIAGIIKLYGPVLSIGQLSPATVSASSAESRAASEKLNEIVSYAGRSPHLLTVSDEKPEQIFIGSMLKLPSCCVDQSVKIFRKKFRRMKVRHSNSATERPRPQNGCISYRANGGHPRKPGLLPWSPAFFASTDPISWTHIT